MTDASAAAKMMPELKALPPVAMTISSDDMKTLRLHFDEPVSVELQKSILAMWNEHQRRASAPPPEGTVDNVDFDKLAWAAISTLSHLNMHTQMTVQKRVADIMRSVAAPSPAQAMPSPQFIAMFKAWCGEWDDFDPFLLQDFFEASGHCEWYAPEFASDVDDQKMRLKASPSALASAGPVQWDREIVADHAERWIKAGCVTGWDIGELKKDLTQGSAAEQNGDAI